VIDWRHPQNAAPRSKPQFEAECSCSAPSTNGKRPLSWPCRELVLSPNHAVLHMAQSQPHPVHQHRRSLPIPPGPSLLLPSCLTATFAWRSGPESCMSIVTAAGDDDHEPPRVISYNQGAYQHQVRASWFAAVDAIRSGRGRKTNQALSHTETVCANPHPRHRRGTQVWTDVCFPYILTVHMCFVGANTTNRGAFHRHLCQNAFEQRRGESDQIPWLAVTEAKTEIRTPARRWIRGVAAASGAAARARRRS